MPCKNAFSIKGIAIIEQEYFNKCSFSEKNNARVKESHYWPCLDPFFLLEKGVVDRAIIG